ncbi:NADH dehydrogenase [Fulvivirga imtechensis AK7]|uniref:NADH:ubiquinone reductase (non-electrogenic) n=1 Tax=Fulvivirga imtechensis AK7 TaxID=1237149 RepID=L8JYP9_9BACT|nr:NAD(P)/FAD-dependent oxidoreductase [Fulvivirga imtechensis]ELR73283.1 NADH dehydrogenase [Fulvivirga imtechensis AK7]
MPEQVIELLKEQHEEKPVRELNDLGIRKTERPRLVILGGGFGGLHLIRALRKQDFQVVLIDKQNHHTFQPLLYQVATSGLEADSIAYPLRKPLNAHPDCHFRMVEVTEVVPEKNLVVTNGGTLRYDYLVIATGARTNYFGMKDIERHALPMKSISDAIGIRNRLLRNYEEALLINDPEQKDQLMNVVIAGGGPTGVELAGAIAEFKKYIMPHDYPDLDVKSAKIHLIELTPELLPAMSDEASQKAEEYLRQLSVIIKTNTKIEGYDGRVVRTDAGNIPARVMLWTGGVSGAILPGLGKGLVTKKGRIKANASGRVKGYDNVFAIGDVAQIETKNYPQGHPQLASVAVQQGKFLATNLTRHIKGKELKEFHYINKGTMATVGRKKAVVDMKKWKFHGAAAWLVWLSVHLYSLVGFKNKVVTFINWAWNYFNHDRETRLIIKD